MTDVEATTFERLLNDPMVRLMMRADRVDTADMIATMRQARDAIAARQRRTSKGTRRRAAAPVLVAMSGRA
jgi:hypothetical protein